jgi:dextranase
MNKIKFDCYPDKAQYLAGETVQILFEGEPGVTVDAIEVSVLELEKEIVTKKIVGEELSEGGIICRMKLSLPVGNYGVDAYIRSGEKESRLHTAFDIVASCRDSIRYGFLTDFKKEEEDTSDIAYAVKLHLNTIQFYDWMYRHDSLLPPTEEYQEPLGRDISLQTVRNKIEACKKAGIRPFAYGAVYAASKEAYEQNPEWAFYKKNGEALTFHDWLVFMDTSKDSPWYRHIIKEYVQVIRQLGFQGIQMDTYGFPKHARNKKGERISLAQTFPDMINEARAAVQQVDKTAGVIFNAVNNWPVEYVAKTAQDAVYIEIWPPHVTYYQIYELVREAKYLGAGQVVLAAYIEAFRAARTKEGIQAAETSFLLTNAVIQASGATHIVHGEKNGLLRDSYFVNYEKLREEFIPMVRAYCDFTVRYGKILFDRTAMDISRTAAGGINEDILFLHSGQNEIAFSSFGEGGKIWTIIREESSRLTINLINLRDNDGIWNQPKYHRPEPVRDIRIDVLMDADIKGAYYATPDTCETGPVCLEYETMQRENGQHVLLHVPRLELWDLIWIEI